MAKGRGVAEDAKIEPGFLDRVLEGKIARFTPTSEDELRLHLSLLLKEAVRARYYSQDHAARTLGTTQPVMSAIVNQKIEGISTEYMLRLAIKDGLIRGIDVQVIDPGETYEGG